MIQRRFYRVNCAAQGDLNHQGMTYRVRLENLSLGGALVSSDECIVIPDGDCCALCFLLDGEDLPLILTVEVVHSFFSMVGVKFVGFAQDAERRLSELLQAIGPPANP